MLQEATAGFGRLAAVIETPEGRDPSPPGPAGSLLGDALALAAACAVAAAAEVADAGVPGVVAMRYNVYVVTAAQYTADLYAHLLAGCWQAAGPGCHHRPPCPRR